MSTASTSIQKAVPVRNSGRDLAENDQAADNNQPLREVVSALLIVEDTEPEKVSLVLMLLNAERLKQPNKYIKLKIVEKQMAVNLADAMADSESQNKEMQLRPVPPQGPALQRLIECCLKPVPACGIQPAVPLGASNNYITFLGLLPCLLLVIDLTKLDRFNI